MSVLTQDLNIVQGATFSQVLRWETTPIVYKAITAIPNTAPATLTVVGHGVPNGWRVAITAVKGMTQINAANNPPKASDYHVATVTGVDTIVLNDVNPAVFKAYTSGGYLQYNTPVDLSGFTARMTIKNRVGGTALETMTTVNGKIALDNTAKTITLTLSATDTAAYTWSKGVYDLELISAGGVVTSLLSGSVTVTKEVTT